jgi:acetyl-CoA C-acetyltransferase
MVDGCAARIAAGESTVALVCSGEALASLRACAAEGVEPPGWSRDPGGPAAPAPEEYASEQMIRYGLIHPIRGYPLYENAHRAARGQSLAEAQRASAEMYAAFSAVAAGNEAAWDPVIRSAEEIEKVGEGNRMVCFPYPLRMNARMDVDQAAAVLVTSLERARELGVPRDRIVHVWGGAGASDCDDLLERVSYARSPAMEASLSGALTAAEIEPSAVDALDVYSCFPVVPKIAAEVLGVPLDGGLTATGGLTSFGGPVSGYSLHAIVAVARQIRDGALVGLVYGNGEYLTKHHTLLLGAAPHRRGYVGVRGAVAPRVNGGPPPLREAADGAATVETFTVEFDRTGDPALGYVIGRSRDGARFAAHARDRVTLAALTDTALEAVGRAGTVEHGDDGRNHFRIAA